MRRPPLLARRIFGAIIVLDGQTRRLLGLLLLIIEGGSWLGDLRGSPRMERLLRHVVERINVCLLLVHVKRKLRAVVGCAHVLGREGTLLLEAIKVDYALLLGARRGHGRLEFILLLQILLCCVRATLAIFDAVARYLVEDRRARVSAIIAVGLQTGR